MHIKPEPHPVTHPWLLCLLAGLVMAYGWGYRGIVGHEGGAMVPGALLGLAVCLGSGRADWYRRAAVAGLFGAAGWAWGGSMSYMEQTMYTVSDAFPDVFYGYSVLFLMGGIWAGIGGGLLGMALTLPRSALQRFAGPFTAMGVAFFLVYLYLFFDHQSRDVYERFVAQNFHDGDFFAAVLTLVVCGVYAVVRKQERAEALFFVWACVAWFAGYLILTKFGGIQLGPPYRSESWGGVLGILVAVMVYLARTRNRAALLLAWYGVVGGGLAFALAVFIRHPVRVGWGPFASWNGMMQWKIAEESFGFLMGLAIALGAVRLLRGGLAAPEEDVPRKPLDIYAVCIVVIVLLWMNVRRGPERWMYRYEVVSQDPVAGLAPWVWYILAGLVLTALGLQALRLYARNELALAPSTAFGKGVWVLFFLMWSTVVTGFAQMLPGARTEAHPIVDMTFVGLAGAVTALLLWLGNPSLRSAGAGEGVARSDVRWRPGVPVYGAAVAAPIILVAISLLSMAMQDGAANGARKRFGPEAYYREALAVMGRWNVVGASSRPTGVPEGPAATDVATFDFARDRSVIVTFDSGERVVDAHRWFHADSRIHLDWYGRTADHAEAATVVIAVDGGKLYIPWPPGQGGGTYLVLEREP